MSRVRRVGWRGPSSLVLRFGLVSALLAGLLGLVLTSWLSNLIRTTNVAHVEDTATYSMNLVIGAIDVKPDQRGDLNAAQYVQIGGLLKALVGTGKFAGATAWVSPSTVAYALEPGRIGVHEGSRPQVAYALSGHLTSTLVHTPVPGVPDVTERAALSQGGPVLEVFVPIRLNNGNAAVVFYERWQPVQRIVNRQISHMLGLVLAGLLALWLGLLRFVLTASRRLQAQVAANLELASNDPLTGLPNRTVLRERVQRALGTTGGTRRHTGLLLLDLDRFKEVNDTLGHHHGDLLLQQVGPRLQSVLRQGDSVARLGGDEFVVLLSDVDDAATASTVAKRVAVALSAPFLLDTVSVDLEVSIGVALSPQHGTDFDDLLQHADIAMYAAKASRSGFELYESDADDASPEKLAMLGQLRTALKEPSQLVVHYQPKADLLTGEVIGVEALVRWQHPTHGMMAPSEFIPLAERTGLIHPLTIEVLQQALGQIRAWSQLGLQLKVAVNISTRCLDEKLPDLVSRLLRENRVPASKLGLEITESAIMADPNRAIEVLTRLQAIGVRLSIDDFGTGYSSMAYLKRLPVHELKIDQSFVTGMTLGSVDTAIVRSCIELARNLGMTVVAEGVETAVVWNQLTELGCDFAQGYYLAKPMPAEQIYGWIAERSQRNCADDPVIVRGHV